VRPLPRQGLRETAAITRRHHVRQHASLRGLYNVVGGKLTTFRSLAEDAVDQVVARLGRRGARCATATAALPGGGATPLDVETELQRFPALSARSRRHLADTYGTRAERVAALALAEPALAEPVCAWSHAIGAEVVYAFQEEFAGSLALARTSGAPPARVLPTSVRASSAGMRTACGPSTRPGRPRPRCSAPWRSRRACSRLPDEVPRRG
jgi:glycerol-3-phosphate dehydrogenase